MMKPKLSVKITGPTDLFSHSGLLKGQTISEDTAMEKENVDEVMMGKPLSVAVCSCLRLGLLYPTTGGKVHRDEGWKHSDMSGNWQWYCGREGHCGLGYLEGSAVLEILDCWERADPSPYPRRLADLVTCAVYGWRNFTHDKGDCTGAWRAQMPSVLSSFPPGHPMGKALGVPVPFLTSDAFLRKDWEAQHGHLSVSSESAMIMKHELQVIGPRLSGLLGTAPLVSAKAAKWRLAESLDRLSFAAEVTCEVMEKTYSALQGTKPPFDTADLGKAEEASDAIVDEAPSVSFKDISFKDLVENTPIVNVAEVKSDINQNVFIGYEAGYPQKTGFSNVLVTVDQSNDGTAVDDFEVSPPAEQPATKPLSALPESLIRLKTVLETLDLSPAEAVEILLEHHRNSARVVTRKPKRREEDREAEWDAIEI
jgi:hypothetical protein